MSSRLLQRREEPTRDFVPGTAERRERPRGDDLGLACHPRENAEEQLPMDPTIGARSSSASARAPGVGLSGALLDRPTGRMSADRLPTYGPAGRSRPVGPHAVPCADIGARRFRQAALGSRGGRRSSTHGRRAPQVRCRARRRSATLLDIRGGPSDVHEHRERSAHAWHLKVSIGDVACSDRFRCMVTRSAQCRRRSRSDRGGGSRKLGEQQNRVNTGEVVQASRAIAFRDAVNVAARSRSKTSSRGTT